MKLIALYMRFSGWLGLTMRDDAGILLTFAITIAGLRTFSPGWSRRSCKPGVPLRKAIPLNRYALNFIQAHFVPASIIQLRRARR
jgi:hypothetical protein